jgi:hypothetical protein
VKFVTAKPSRKARETRTAASGAVPAPKFWVRAPSRELDRTGDFILKHLAHIRQETDSRAGLA